MLYFLQIVFVSIDLWFSSIFWHVPLCSFWTSHYISIYVCLMSVLLHVCFAVWKKKNFASAPTWKKVNSTLVVLRTCEWSGREPGRILAGAGARMERHIRMESPCLSLRLTQPLQDNSHAYGVILMLSICHARAINRTANLYYSIIKLKLDWRWSSVQSLKSI